MEQLISGPYQRGMCPVVDFDRAPGLPCKQGLEVRRCSERAVYDLRGKGRIDAAHRATAELGIERGRGPRVVARNPVKYAGRYESGGSYHGAKLTRVVGTGTEIGGLDNRVIP